MPNKMFMYDTNNWFTIFNYCRTTYTVGLNYAIDKFNDLN